MFPPIITSDELLAQEKAEANAQNLSKEPVVSSLAQHIKNIWSIAKRAKASIGEEMVRCIRQRNGEYSPEKLAELKKIRSSEAYLLLTNTKCRAGEAWVKDIVLPSGQKPFDIEPTPTPTIPKEIELEIRFSFFKEAITQLLVNSVISGEAVDTLSIIEKIREMMPEFERRVKKLIFEKAKEQVDEIEKAVNDTLIEGGWYQAINDCIFDFVTYPVCVLKGPVVRMQMVRRQVTDPQTGLLKVVYEKRKVPQYNRVSPFDIFPVKDAIGIQDGDIIERLYWTPEELSSLIGLPGYNTEEIEAVLEEYENKKLNEWVTDVDQARAEQEQLRRDGDYQSDLTKIPALEWWGTVSGRKLREWGMEGVEDKKIYHATAWLIGNHVIGAKLNNNLNGEKPYSIASFEEIPGAFYGRSIPYLTRDLEAIMNATARALVNNVGIASGPQVEIDIDRIPPGFDYTLWPWKQWPTRESTMAGNQPAITFYQPSLVADKLIHILTTFQRIADETIIPAYAHGDPNVGGGGNTASGLSMLFGASARNIKMAVKNFDDKIIATSVERQFYFEIEHGEHRGMWTDIKIVARGSESLNIREQQAIRLGEFARDVANPTDFMITGLEGRKYLIKARAQALNLDADKIVQDDLQMGSPIVPNMGNMPGDRTLDVAGNPAQGVDYKTVEGEENVQGHR